MRKAILLLSALPIFSGLCAPAFAASPEALLEAFAKQAAATRDLSARFVQTTTMKAVEMERTSRGTAVFQKGGRMRWAYEGDDPQVLVSDGKTLWMHQVRDRTVVKKPVASLTPAARAALDILGGFSDVAAHFSLSSCGERCVELTPKRPDPDLARVRIEFSAPPARLGSVATEDPVGNVTRVEFSDLKTDTGVDAALFDFVPPKGVDVVDAGAEGSR